MLATPESALIRRIADPRRDLRDLIQEIVKATDVSDAVLDALDQRILDSGVSAPSMMVRPYLERYMRHGLFAALCATRSFSNSDLAELFKAGFGDKSIENKLCDWLYSMYGQEANPSRFVVVEALRERGGPQSLELLQDIRFELVPKLKTDILVARSIAQFDEVDGKQFLKVVTTGALEKFVALLDSAVEVLRNRVGGEDADRRLPAERSSTALGRSSSADPVPVSSGPQHKRSAKVAKYRLKAESLLVDHPDAALNNIRKAAEAICKDLLDETIARAKGGGGKPLHGLEDMKSELKQRKVAIPADAEKYLESIQSFGNLGSHDQELNADRIDSRMAQATLSHLEALIEWYKCFDPSLPQSPGANQT